MEPAQQTPVKAATPGTSASQAKPSSQHTPSRKCACCGTKLGSSYSKPICQKCIDGLVKEIPATVSKEMALVRGELASVLSSMKEMFDQFKSKELTPPVPTTAGTIVSVSEVLAPSPTANNDDSEADSSRAGSSDSDDSSQEEGIKPARFKLPLEEVETLLKAV